MKLEPLADKWRSFGWNVIQCDGNDMPGLLEAFRQAAKPKDKPQVILARTLMGKGIRSIEGDYRWHGKPPTKEQVPGFLEELRNAD
jgi:transketolase